MWIFSRHVWKKSSNYLACAHVHVISSRTEEWLECLSGVDERYVNLCQSAVGRTGLDSWGQPMRNNTHIQSPFTSTIRNLLHRKINRSTASDSIFWCCTLIYNYIKHVTLRYIDCANHSYRAFHTFESMLYIKFLSVRNGSIWFTREIHGNNEDRGVCI